MGHAACDDQLTTTTTTISNQTLHSPGDVQKAAGAPGMGLLVWAIAGIIVCLGSLCYAELGTMIPDTGGEGAYMRAAYVALCDVLSLPPHRHNHNHNKLRSPNCYFPRADLEMALRLCSPGHLSGC